jgi:NAD(P)-dependent dehydrogenase (short-subunit alcohol dehydrogenase family)
MSKFNEQSVLVTGGASGLGLASVCHFHALGANVVILDLEQSIGKQIAADLGGRAVFVAGTVTDPQDVQRSINAAQDLAPLRIVVAAAGVGPPAKLFDDEGPIPAVRVKSTFEVNLLGSYNVLACCGNAMSQNQPKNGDRGAIIMTSSISAYDGQIGQVAYAGAKAGVAGMTLPAARELAQYGIRVVTIAPGLFDTPLLASMPEKARQSVAAQIPYPSRLGKPKEYAEMVEYIVSAKMLNGEVIRLDGAIRMGPR